jgi:hypothetical protein
MYLLEVSVPEATVKGDCTISFGSQTSIIEVPFRNKVTFKHPEPQKVKLHLTFSSLSHEVHRFEVPVRNFFVQGLLDEWFSIDADPMESPVRRRNFYEEEYLQASISTKGSSPDKKSVRRFRVVCTIKKQGEEEAADDCHKCLQFEKLLDAVQKENEQLKNARLKAGRRGASMSVEELDEARQNTVEYGKWAHELQVLRLQLKESQQKRLELQSLLAEASAQTRETAEDFTAKVQYLSNEVRAANAASRPEQATSEALALQAELTALKAELSSKKLGASNLSSLKGALERAKASMNFADEQVKRLTAESRAKTEEFRAVEVEWEKINSELTEERRGLRERLDQLVVKLRAKSDESEAYHIEICKLKARLAERELAAELATTQDQAAARHEERARDLEEQNEALLQTLRETEEEQKATLTQIKHQIVALERERKLLEAKAERTAESFRQHEAELTELRADNLKLKALAVVQERDVKGRSDREQLAEQLKVYEQASQNVKDELTQQVEVLTDELILQADKAEQAQRQLTELQAQSPREKERSRRSRYSASKNDPVDSALADYLNRYSDLPVEFKREEPGVYLFGTRKVIVRLEQGRIVVRVGGGYMTLEEFVEVYSPLEVQKLSESMELGRSSSVERIRAHLVSKLNEGWNPCIGVSRRRSPSPLRS